MVKPPHSATPHRLPHPESERRTVSEPLAQTVTPPVAERIPHPTTIHGDTREDDYFWLREKGSPHVNAYLEAENAYTDAVLKHTAGLQEKLYAEMLSHIQETDLSVPYRQGDWLYYSRTEEGKQYPIYCRKQTPDAEEKVTIDLNVLAEGEKFLALGVYVVSDDGNLLAYSTDVTGFREYTLRIKDLRTGELLPDEVKKVGSVVWAADNRTLFYTTEDQAKRPYRVFRHALGTSSDADTLVYEETDGLYRAFTYRSRDRRFVFVGSAAATATELHFLPAATPTASLTRIAPRELEHEYYVDHRDGLFYIRTNRNAVNFRLVTAPVDTPGEEHWTEIVPHRQNVVLDDHDVFARHLVLTEREGGLPRLRIRDLRGDSDPGTVGTSVGSSAREYSVTFPEPTYHVSGDVNREFDTNRFRFRYSSLVTPASIYDYDMGTRERTLLKETPVPGGFDRENYVSEYLFATAQDGTKVPISVVYRKGFVRDGNAPLLLYGYGSYGFSYPPAFNSNRLVMLDRGVVFAIAHIRGGGEFGKPWHDDGKMFRKRNTFTDFIACAEHLIAEKYTSANRLGIMGAGAGGLLMGAVMNLRPDLFHAVVSGVPFVDVLNTMLDETLPLTIGEYLEWGNPHISDQYAYMRTYCPYTNLEAKDYPALLVRTSLNDSQVMYWEPAKYVAKLRTLKTNNTPVLLHTNMAAGHGGASGRYDALKETALDYAFLLWQWGIAD
jgi:oligopeptidase B